MNRKAAPTVASRSLRRIFQSEKLIRILIAIAALLFFQCFSIPLFASKVAQLRTFPGTSFSCLICHHSYFDIIQGHSISQELMHFHKSISQFESLFEAVYILINYFGWYSTEEKSGCNNLYGWFLISFCRGSNNDCVWYVVKPGGGINGKKIGPEVSEPVGRSESQLSSTVSKIYCHRVSSAPLKGFMRLQTWRICSLIQHQYRHEAKVIYPVFLFLLLL